MAETFECMKVDVADLVATVRLARPPVNAQNRRLREEIIALFDTLSDRADVRAIVLTGEGKTFSAGGDQRSCNRGRVRARAMLRYPGRQRGRLPRHGGG